MSARYSENGDICEVERSSLSNIFKKISIKIINVTWVIYFLKQNIAIYLRSTVILIKYIEVHNCVNISSYKPNHPLLVLKKINCRNQTNLQIQIYKDKEYYRRDKWIHKTARWQKQDKW